MNLLYVINGLGFSANTGIGGSDKRAVEIARNINLMSEKHTADILTTSSGYKIFTKSENLKTKYFVIKEPFFWPKFINKFTVGRVLSYLHSTTASLLKVGKVKGYDLYFATSDFFFDVIPSYFYKVVHKKKLVCMIHHHIVSPKARGGMVIINFFMYLSQRFSFWLIVKTADAILLYDTPEGRKIKILLKDKYTKVPQMYFVKNGINKDVIEKAGSPDKKYEACFLGGLRYSKGIDEFAPIWKLVVDKHPEAKFLVIGGGSKEIVKALEEDIKKHSLTKNIILKGPVAGDKLFEIIKSSKLFLFPSHEEGWGIALCEAMYCELPIICYNLPAFKVFGDVLDKYKVGNYRELAQKTIDYLDNPKKIDSKKDRLRKTAEKFTWDNIALEETKIYSQIINKT